MFISLTRQNRIVVAVFLVFAVASLWTSTAYAAEDACTLAGGVWSGSDPDNGVCTYPPGNAVAVAACASSSAIYLVTFEFDFEISSTCIETGVPPSKTRVVSDGGSETNFILRLKGDRNGWVEFFGGSCQQNCTIDHILPDLTEQSLDDTPLATLYVRVDGGAGMGSYRVCFSNPLGEGLNLYQFVGGNWILAAHSNSNPICSEANGDSAFYLH